MIKATFFLFVVFGADDAREDIRGRREFKTADACWEEALSYTKRKPPDGGFYVVACKIEDLGPTQ